MLKKAYTEITNICNLNCSFCHKTKREKAFMSPEDFRLYAEKIRPHTQYIYLHLMGEPLLHPQLGEILDICASLGFRICLTTNGTLIKERQDMLLFCSALYKVSFSLQAMSGNKDDANVSPDGEYLDNIIRFAEKAAENGTITVFRMWNRGADESLNSFTEEKLKRAFSGECAVCRNGYRLGERIFLEYGDHFEWPDMTAEEKNPSFCMGLRDQIGVLVNGDVVPCCLDCEGDITLGNLRTGTVEEILASPKAKAIYDGFSAGKAVNELCRRCDYAKNKFSK